MTELDPVHEPSLQEKNKVQLNTFHWLVLTIVCTFLGFMAGSMYNPLVYIPRFSKLRTSAIYPTPIPQPTSYQVHNTCEFYGARPKEDFLDQYIVKEGDSLLSIAKNTLQDQSRVNEIVLFNSDQYPTLSFENPFIERGWNIFLPPASLPSQNLDVTMYSGELGGVPDEHNDWYDLMTQTGTTPFFPDDETVYEGLGGIEDLTIGRCYSLVRPYRELKVLKLIAE